MVTGDYHNTAIAVARDVGMVRPQTRVIVIDTVSRPRQHSTLPIRAAQMASRAASVDCAPKLSFLEQRDILPPGVDDPEQLGDQSQEHCHMTLNPFVLPGSRCKHVSWVQMPEDAEEQAQHVLQDVQQADAGALDTRSRSKGMVTIQHLNPEDSKAISCKPPPHSARPSSLLMSPARPKPAPDRLRFLMAGTETLDASEALSALAEGQVQCAVTGHALEHLLQSHDLSVLETVMRSVVVFSRMQPHQKGQVVDLLGMSGIHQLHNGQPRFIPVCSYSLCLAAQIGLVCVECHTHHPCLL